jgi:hypothetical protein
MRSNYRGVPFEITRAGSAYYLKAGDRRVELGPDDVD